MGVEGKNGEGEWVVALVCRTFEIGGEDGALADCGVVSGLLSFCSAKDGR